MHRTKSWGYLYRVLVKFHLCHHRHWSGTLHICKGLTHRNQYISWSKFAFSVFLIFFHFFVYFWIFFNFFFYLKFSFSPFTTFSFNCLHSVLTLSISLLSLSHTISVFQFFRFNFSLSIGDCQLMSSNWNLSIFLYKPSSLPIFLLQFFF